MRRLTLALCWAVCLAGLGLASAATAQALDAEIRGRVLPVREAVISSQLAGRILKVPYREGTRFKAGAALIEFDCRLFKAELAAARAESLAARKTLANRKRLNQLKAASALEVELADAEHRKFAARVRIAQVHVSRCVIDAPFAGRVLTAFVKAHESVATAEKLLAIVDDSEYEIELILPSSWLTWLRNGQRFEFTVDESGGVYAAHIERLSAGVDAVSQTVRAFARFEGKVDGVLSGMSGSARFPDPKQ